MKGNLARAVMPYRFLIAAAVLAAIFCLMPIHVDAPETQDTPNLAQTQQEDRQVIAAQSTQAPAIPGVPVGADLSERTQSGAYLHRTVRYTPCGHSVQRREALPAQLCGLSQAALESALGDVIPGARMTGFTAQEVDVALEMEIPCPLHWMLRTGENGKLQVLQNTAGEALSVVRETQISPALLEEDTRAQLLDGMIFDDVQQLEGYLESLES